MLEPPTTRRATWPYMLAALAMIWGSSFLLMKVGLKSFEPFQLACVRVMSGAVVMGAVLVATRDRLPAWGPVWRHAFVIGLAMNAIPFTLFAWGETHASSIQAGIWNATTPLFTLLVLAFIVRAERLTATTVVGLVLGFAGVVVVLAPWNGLGDGSAIGQLAFAVGAMLYGVGTPYMRRAFGGRSESVVALTAAQLICASAVMLVLTAIAEGPPSGDIRMDALLATLTLGAVGTGVAYLLFTTIIRAAGAAIAASVTYVQPIVSTTLGAVILGEAIGWSEPVGMVVILIGVALTALAPRPARAVSVNEPGSAPDPAPDPDVTSRESLRAAPGSG